MFRVEFPDVYEKTLRNSDRTCSNLAVDDGDEDQDKL